MKRRIWPWMLCGLGVCLPAFGATYTLSGTVSFVRSHATALPTLDWFSLSGGTSAGTCGVLNGLVVIRIEDDDRGMRHFAMLMAAKGKNASVVAYLDDAVKDSYGYCILQYVQY